MQTSIGEAGGEAPYGSRRTRYEAERKGAGREGERWYGVISWVFVGMIVGMLAKRVVPGEGPGGFVITVLLGMAGASVSGFLVSILCGTGATGFNVWSILVATLGVLFLLLYGLVARRTT